MYIERFNVLLLVFDVRYRNGVHHLEFFLESMDSLLFEIFSVGLSVIGRLKFINSFMTGNNILLKMVSYLSLCVCSICA